MSQGTRAWDVRRARYKREGRCRYCGIFIGEPPQQTRCGGCKKKNKASQSSLVRSDSGAVPTFEQFEHEERLPK